MKSLLILAASLCLSAPAHAEESLLKSGATTITVVRTALTQTWVGNCDHDDGQPCANSLSFQGFDKDGKLRLIYTELTVRVAKGQYLPKSTTAFIVEDNQSISNFGNQFPQKELNFGEALDLASDKCPVALTVTAHAKVIDLHSPCHFDGP